MALHGALPGMAPSKPQGLARPRPILSCAVNSIASPASDRRNHRRCPSLKRPTAVCRYQGCTSSVDSWLDMVHSLPPDSDLHHQLVDLLVAQPEALRCNPHRVASIARLLLHATHKQRLYTSWSYPPEVLLSLAADWRPEQLRDALTALQQVVDGALDGLADVSDLLAACAPNVEPLLLLDKRELVRKAELIRRLVPEFTPATVIRACPELLLNWHAAELEAGISRAGDVVVLGRDVTVELLLEGTNTSSTSSSNSSGAGTGAQEPPSVQRPVGPQAVRRAGGAVPPSMQQLAAGSATPVGVGSVQGAEGNAGGAVAVQEGGPQSTGNAASGDVGQVRASGGPREWRQRWSADSAAQRQLPGSCVRLSRRVPCGLQSHSLSSASGSSLSSTSYDGTDEGCSAEDLASPPPPVVVHQDMFAHPRSRAGREAAAAARAAAGSGGGAGSEEEASEELCVLSNSRMLLYVNNKLAEVRFQDPFRQEEAFRASGGSQRTGGQGFTPRSWLVWPAQTARQQQATGGGRRRTV